MVSNLPPLTPGAPALVVEINTPNVLHRPSLWLERRRQASAHAVAAVLGVPSSKVGTSRGSRAVVLVPVPTPDAPVLRGIHISITDMVKRRRLVVGAPPQPRGTQGVSCAVRRMTAVRQCR